MIGDRTPAPGPLLMPLTGQAVTQQRQALASSQRPDRGHGRLRRWPAAYRHSARLKADARCLAREPPSVAAGNQPIPLGNSCRTFVPIAPFHATQQIARLGR